jgi:hypothetical protein
MVGIEQQGRVLMAKRKQPVAAQRTYRHSPFGNHVPAFFMRQWDEPGYVYRLKKGPPPLRPIIIPRYVLKDDRSSRWRRDPVYCRQRRRRLKAMVGRKWRIYHDRRRRGRI